MIWKGFPLTKASCEPEQNLDNAPKCACNVYAPCWTSNIPMVLLLIKEKRGSIEERSGPVTRTVWMGGRYWVGGRLALIRVWTSLSVRPLLYVVPTS